MRNRFRRSALAAAAAFAVLLSILSEPGQEAEAAKAAGCVHPSGYTVCRTDPRGGIDSSIVAELVRQIGRTGRGDTVRASVYQWTLDQPVRPIAQAMVDAERRGVDVKLVVGQRGDRPSQNRAAITRFKNAGIGVVRCKGACLPNPDGRTDGPNHNRFFLIERDGWPTVITTTFNLTGFHVKQAHNLVAVHGDRGLHDFYRAYWQRLYRGSWDGWTQKHKSVAADRTRAWVFPRSGDPVADQLEQVTGCDGGGRVWVAHANFQSGRPAVRAELGRIAGMGCDVKVVVLDQDSNDPSWIAAGSGGGSVRVHDSLRNKFLLVQAEFNGRDANLVWAGTHNLNHNSLKNADDNLLRIRSKAVADVYAEYFLSLWRGSADLWLASLARDHQAPPSPSRSLPAGLARSSAATTGRPPAGR